MNRKEILEELLANKHFKNIVFSLEGSTAEVNDAIRGKNVYVHTVKNIKNLIQLKEEHNREDIIVTINTVLCKKNIDDIKIMIELCLDLHVNEFVILQFIVEGNAINNDESISFEDELKVIELIAEYYSKVKNKLRIVPRFTYPLAKLYAEKVLNREFPEIVHMCGAGTDFAFLNNRGELFPCDRYENPILQINNRDNINLVKNDFWTIWSLDGYGDMFAKTESPYTYENITPCNKCEFLQKDCFPCPVKFDQNTEIINRSCSRLVELIHN